MGEPVVNPEEDPLVVNGDFKSRSGWTTGIDWAISTFNGWASEDSSGGVTQSLDNNVVLNIGETYVISFDMLISNQSAGSGLVTRISFSPLSESVPIFGVGHHSFELLMKNNDVPFSIRSKRLSPAHTFFRITNVSVVSKSTDLAFLKSFLPLDGTKTDKNSSAVGDKNILLAHWNGKSNVLFEVE